MEFQCSGVERADSSHIGKHFVLWGLGGQESGWGVEGERVVRVSASAALLWDDVSCELVREGLGCGSRGKYHDSPGQAVTALMASNSWEQGKMGSAMASSTDSGMMAIE